MRSCPSKAISGLIACSAAAALAGCASNGHPVAHAKTRLTIAQACRQHGTATHAIVSGLVDYKTYMSAADPAFRLTFKHSVVVKRVAPAITDLEAAVKPAPQSGAGKRFFTALDHLERWLQEPASVPNAVVGERNTSRVEQAAKAAGCPL